MMVEFWKKEPFKKIYVNFNRETMSLSSFLAHPEAKVILDLMYKKIQNDYTSELKETSLKTVGEFIKNHFLRLDKTFDVVVQGSEGQKTILMNFDRDRPDDY